MRESSFKNISFIACKSLSVFPSNLRTNFGVVLDALIKPHPLSKFILNPSIVIFSPSKEHSDAKSSIILNLLSSATLILSSGVE